MNRDEWRAAAVAILAHARALREGRQPPPWDAVDGLAWAKAPDAVCETLRAEMRFLADEVAEVLAGRSTTLVVLNDEIASTERALAAL